MDWTKEETIKDYTDDELKEIAKQNNHKKKVQEWKRFNNSSCCGKKILFYGDDFTGFCPECGKDQEFVKPPYGELR